MKRGEPLLAVDDVEGLDADQAVCGLGLKDDGAEKVGDRVLRVCEAGFGLSLDVIPKRGPLLLFVPDVMPLIEWHTVLAAVLIDAVDGDGF